VKCEVKIDILELEAGNLGVGWGEVGGWRDKVYRSKIQPVRTSYSK
jgi:hypothetical protein